MFANSTCVAQCYLRRMVRSATTSSFRYLNASVLNGKTMIIDESRDNRKLHFPGVWLRDNCQCSECFHEHTKSRKVNWEKINIDVRIENVTIGASNTVEIDWSDKHKSIFTFDWLRKRSFSEDDRKNYIERNYRQAPKLWNKNDFQSIKRTFPFDNIMKYDNELLSWLETLAEHGFAMINNAPSQTTIARQLAERIGYIKRTTYGEEFEVKAKENAHNYAYMMTPLPLHTDMPYYEYKAGINILHCYNQSNSEGGANLMTDGFYIAEKLRRENFDYYKILLETPVNWYDIGKDSGMTFHNIYRAPVICLDVDGKYARINHNTTKRDSYFTVPLDLVESWYEAYNKFLELAYAEAVEFKTQSGDVFVFNNLRMLHGRTPYQDSPKNKRHLIGSYVDWDVIYSKIRVLQSLKKN